MEAINPSHSRPARLHIPPISLIHLIHFRKVIHTSQKHIDFDHLLDNGACFLEDSSEVLDALML
jgi:hypothetical protein